jgi:arsenate reductase
VSVRVYAYANCDTCRKALKFLAARKIAAEVIPIREQPPSVAELRRMLAHLGGDVRKLFNTAGRDYRARDLKSRLPELSVDEALELLAGHGNLVKRPFAISPAAAAVGFRAEEWERFCT